jgi:AcrR family transcriptional regulator
MADEASLRERKKRGTRARLIATAIDLFNERGFDAVTVQDIVSRADVSPRTFFRYFGSKEAVLFADMDDLLEVMRDAIAGSPDDLPPLGIVRAAIAAATEHWSAHPSEHSARIRLSATGAEIATYQKGVLQPQWEEALAHELADRLDLELDLDIRPRLLAGVAMAVMASVNGRWLESGQQADVIALLDEAFTALVQAADDLGR